MTRPDLWISPEEIADIRASMPSEREAIRYWLVTGLPEGYLLADTYPQELIDEVQAELDEETNKKIAAMLGEADPHLMWFHESVLEIESE